MFTMSTLPATGTALPAPDGVLRAMEENAPEPTVNIAPANVDYDFGRVITEVSTGPARADSGVWRYGSSVSIDIECFNG